MRIRKEAGKEVRLDKEDVIKMKETGEEEEEEDV